MAKPNAKYIDPYCDPCIKEGFVKGAAGFCPKCADFLCKSCLDSHGEESSTGSHKILTGSAMPARQSEKPLKYDSCERHPLELKDSYCLDHGVFTCSKCATKEHVDCDVKSILLAFKSFNISAEDQAFKGTASHFLGHAQQLQMSVGENLVELEKQKNQLIQDSQDFRVQMTNQIRQSCEDFERKVLRQYMEKKGFLAEKLTKISDVVTNIEGALEDLQRQGIRTLGEARYFMHLKGHTETVFSCSEKLKELHENLSYIDMTSQFYICINPVALPQNNFLDISLQFDNYEYENIVPDIHIPCINKQPEKSNALDVEGMNQAAMPVPPTRRNKASARIRPVDVEKVTPASTADQELNSNPFSATNEKFDLTRNDSTGEPVTSANVQTTKADSNTNLDHQVVTRKSSGISTGNHSTDDQKLKGSTKTKGDATFRRLSLALEASAKYRPSSVVILDPIKVGIHGDERACLILGVDVTYDGNVLLLDRNNRKLKMFTQDGEYKASKKVPKNPEGLAVISETRAAVSTWNKLIGIVDITQGSLALKKTIQLDYSVWGIAGYRDHLIVTCSPSQNATQAPTTVRMIDMQGKVKWSVSSDAENADLFQWAGFLTVRYGASKDTVIVTDQFKQTLTVLNAHNGSVLKVVSVAGRTPKGVTSDENGEVFVCYDAGAIMLWSVDLSKEKSPGTIDMKSPYALTYDKKRKELYVASHSEDSKYSDFVHRYHFRR